VTPVSAADGGPAAPEPAPSGDPAVPKSVPSGGPDPARRLVTKVSGRLPQLPGRRRPVLPTRLTGSAPARLIKRASRALAHNPDVAGAGFARITVLPAILVLAWLVPGLPLLLAGAFLPVPMMLIAVPLAVVLSVVALRRVPSAWPRAMPGLRRERSRDVWYGLAGTLVVAGGFMAWQLLYSSQTLIVLRDSGSYLQAGYWIAQHGSLPIPQSLAAFGGSHPGMSFNSFGFLGSGTSIVPSMVPGQPMLLAAGFWIHGAPGATAVGAILGGLAVLAFGGLVGRLAGPRWAGPGALVLGLTLPEQYTSRSALSEIAVQVLLFGGLCLVIDAVTLRTGARPGIRRPPARIAPATAVSAGPGTVSAAGAAPGPVPAAGPVAAPGPAAGSGPANAAAVRAAATPATDGPIVIRSSTDSAAGAAPDAAAGPAAGRGSGTAVPAGAPGPAGDALAGPARPAGEGAGTRPAGLGSDHTIALAHPVPPRWQERLHLPDVREWYTPPRAMLAVGGLALGLTGLIQVIGLLDVIPALAFLGILVAGRRAVGSAFTIGLVIGAGYSVAAAYLLARPFMVSLKPVPEAIGLIAVFVAALMVAIVELMRYPRIRSFVARVFRARPLRWLPEVGGILVALALVALALRPYFQTVRASTSSAEASYVAVLQQAEHLRPDPGRTYAEDTLYWLVWYAGIPAVLLGFFGLALIVRRVIRAMIAWSDPSGAARTWALPAVVLAFGAAGVLWDPAITPDQPAASRRLVPVVLPALVLGAIWASAWLVGRARSRGAGAVATSFVAVCCVAALLVPTAVTTFGLDVNHNGPHGGLQAQASGLALARTGTGETSAVERLCASIRPGSSVIFLDYPTAASFAQVVRGMCDVPTTSMAGQPASAVSAVISGIGRAGRRPVLLGAKMKKLSGFGGNPVQVLHLSTTEQPQTLTQPPTARWRVNYVIWMSVPTGFSVGTSAKIRPARTGLEPSRPADLPEAALAHTVIPHSTRGGAVR
jgi:hypothetical protein